MTQRKAVISALEEHGGYATLEDIYRSALGKSGCRWGTKMPHATIRRILQTDEDTFFRIRPGLWGLKKDEQQILGKLGIGSKVKQKQIQQFDHAYYQRLLATWGKLKGYDAYIPPQDRGKKYLDTTLGSLSTIQELPEFTYPELVRTASYVDVIMSTVLCRYFGIDHRTARLKVPSTGAAYRHLLGQVRNIIWHVYKSPFQDCL